MSRYVGFSMLLALSVLFMSCSKNTTVGIDTFDSQIEELRLELDGLERELVLKSEYVTQLETENKKYLEMVTLAEEENEKLKVKISRLRDDNLIYGDNIKTLFEDVTECEFSLIEQQCINRDYREFIDAHMTHTDLNEDNITVNTIGLGSSYKDVSEVFGGPSEEKVGMNEAGYGSSSYMTWKYNDDMVFVFDPFYLNRIEITSSEYDFSKIGIRVGDLAIESLEYMNEHYKSFVSPHTGEHLMGWYYTENGDVIIIICNKDMNLYQEDMTITSETMVTGITIGYREIFD